MGTSRRFHGRTLVGRRLFSEHLAHEVRVKKTRQSCMTTEEESTTATNAGLKKIKLKNISGLLERSLALEVF